MQITQDKKRSLFIKSYGCQMNEYDSERMIEILEKHNYSSVDEPRQADLIILNTCHIREKAAEKIYSELFLSWYSEKPCTSNIIAVQAGFV